MSGDDSLTEAQKRAASYTDTHARLLAGPGTGKTRTLSRRAAYLIERTGIPPSQILVLTFTRAATHQLRQGVALALGASTTVLPRIYTLHAFSLRQLLRNASVLTALPRPIRIADDWEERHIIWEDLKSILTLRRIDAVQDKFNRLSADWETLAAEGQDWEKAYPDPQFLGAWGEHRQIYGYTLRSELVYRLKRALEQNPDFNLEQPFQHILVDEYQDLNRCDLAVIRAIASKGGQLFVAGDDDQSIYGFRFANPDGIRQFEQEYKPSTTLTLEECHRCDRRILALGQFVAGLDPRRIPKHIKPVSDAKEGEVNVLWFRDQNEEADTVAKICRHLIDHESYKPGSILILIRSDRYGAFSTPLQTALQAHDIPVTIGGVRNPLDADDGRQVHSLLRLFMNPQDHLAWRTLLQLRQNNIGKAALAAVYQQALLNDPHLGFVGALQQNRTAPGSIPKFGNRLIQEMMAIEDLLRKVSLETTEKEQLAAAISHLAGHVADGSTRSDEIVSYIKGVMDRAEVTNLEELLTALSVSSEDIEQEMDPEKVNLLTMHKAKGLTADIVFQVAAEDEYVPGINEQEPKLGDERRLLYVSLTRAKHKLFITYCRQRTEQQRYTGRTSGKLRRNLTRFLADAPIHPVPGPQYLASIQ